MATVYDVEQVVVSQDDQALFSYSVPSGGAITMFTAGPQGAPGVQNVYTGLVNPATIPGQEWGMDEAGFIWIEVDV
jgi:hypothetical protein